MRSATLAASFFGLAALTLGCSDSPRSQEQVRRETAAATATVASDIKGAALGVRDGLASAAGHRDGPTADKDKININTASRLSLMTLPGVTTTSAGDIVAHRPYRDPADLRRKKVVTPEVYDQISGRITTASN